MKLKTVIVGAAGVLLFFTGQNLGAEDILPAPDRAQSVLPAPDSGDALPPPNPDDALPPPARAVKAQASRITFLWPAGGSAGGQGTSSAQVSRRGPGGSAGGQGVTPVRPGAAAAPRVSRPWPWTLPSTGLYVGGMAGLGYSDYNTDGADWEEKYNRGSIEGSDSGALGLFMGLDFGGLIFELGAQTSFDKGEIEYNKADVESTALHVPLLVKADFHLGPVVLQPLFGPYFNLALGDLNVKGSGDDPYANPPFGLVFGGLAGLTLGRGLLFIDGRYEMDLGKTVAGSDAITIWSRSAFTFNFGYQLYLGRRR